MYAYGHEWNIFKIFYTSKAKAMGVWGNLIDDQQINAISETTVETIKLNDEKLSNIERKVERNQDSVMSEICYKDKKKLLWKPFEINGLPIHTKTHKIHTVINNIDITLNLSHHVPIWGWGYSSQTHLNILQRLQNKAIRSLL